MLNVKDKVIRPASAWGESGTVVEVNDQDLETPIFKNGQNEIAMPAIGGIVIDWGGGSISRYAFAQIEELRIQKVG